MNLPTQLISEFVKVTTDEVEVKKESTVYGTIVEYNNSMCVRLDGSDLLTPITYTTDIKDGDRVIVMIKNHTATVTGNTTSPSASTTVVTKVVENVLDIQNVVARNIESTTAKFEELETKNATITGELDANKASIKKLEAQDVKINGSLNVVKENVEILDANKMSVEDADLKYATITNLEAANAEIRSLTADYGEFKQLTVDDFIAVKADIETLDAQKINVDTANAKYATIENLNAAKADIDNLEVEYGEFKHLTVEDLDAIKADIDSLDATYVNIDFSNINKAWMDEFYAKSGLIENVTMGDGTVTGYLVGVTIKGDLIEGNTIVADKLVIKGDDGLYYKLNTNGETIETEQDNTNSLDGSIITAKSITATKISVTDLVAFGATIGGFHITDKAIYSGVKTSVDNTTRGIFLGAEGGQIAFGDANNYVKFYKDVDGNYKLAVSASSITFGGNHTNVEEAIGDVQSDIDDLTIGGRNLLANTGFMYTRSNTAENVVFESISIASGCSLEELVDIPMTLSFYVYAPGSRDTSLNDDTSINNRFGMLCKASWRDSTGINVDTTTYHYMANLINADILGERVSQTSVINYPEGYDTPTEIVFRIFMYAKPASDNDETWQLGYPKLERGTRATDWSPAPEDIDDALTETGKTIDDTTAKLNDAQVTIDSIQSMIKNLVVGENGETLMTQTDTGWTFNIATIQNNLNTAIKDLDNLGIDVTDINAAVDSLNQSVSDLGEYTDYIRFDTHEGKPCIILGETDSPFKVVITNTDIQFKEGTYTPASISNQSLHIEKAVITDELSQGEFSWMARSNGNYGLVWKGGA